MTTLAFCSALTSLLCAFSAATASPPSLCQDTARCVPRPAIDEEVRAHCQLRVELAETDVSFTVDGEAGEEHDARRVVVVDERASWTDVVHARDGARVMDWTRRFERVEGGVGLSRVGEALDAPAGASPLRGRAVRFVRAEDGELERAFVAEEDARSAAEVALLAGLAVDIGLEAFLPRGPVELGEAWTVDVSALVDVLSPLGELHLDDEKDDLIAIGSYSGFTAPLLPPAPRLWWSGLEGAVEVTLAAVEAGPRGDVLRFELKVDAQGTSSATRWLQDRATASFDPRVERLVVESGLRGSGTLLWDQGRGAPLSWSFRADATAVLDAAWALVQRQTYHLVARRRSVGTVAAALTFER